MTYGSQERAEVLAEALGLVEAERDRYRAALQKIDRLSRKWSAPLASNSHSAWGAVGSEADLIAHRALGGSLESARARLIPTLDGPTPTALTEGGPPASSQSPADQDTADKGRAVPGSSHESEGA